MNRNSTPLQQGGLAFAAAAGITLLFELLFAAVGLIDIIALLCPWWIWEYGSNLVILATVACLVGLPVGFLVWLNRTLDEMRSSYGRTIAELKTRIETLEKKLNNTTKD